MIATATKLACIARPVTKYPDVETLRCMRNECRLMMSGDQEYIDEERQEVWWAYHRRSLWSIWLFSVDGVDAGYGLLRWTDKELGWYLSLGLLPAWRGKGIGTAIHRFLVAQKPGDLIIAKMLKTNEASRKAAEASGFRHSHDEDNCHVYTIKGGTIGYVEAPNG